MTEQMPKIIPVYIEWVDSSNARGWRDYEPHDTLLCSTVGHLIERNKHRIAVACSMAHGSEVARWNDIIEIPAEAVKKFKRLRLPG